MISKTATRRAFSTCNHPSICSSSTRSAASCSAGRSPKLSDLSSSNADLRLLNGFSHIEHLFDHHEPYHRQIQEGRREKIFRPRVSLRRFDENGITNEVVEERRPSSYLVTRVINSYGDEVMKVYEVG